MNMTSGIKDMMHQHEIIDIGSNLHVIDGKVFYYESDTIDFESEEQVRNLLGMATDLYVNDFFDEKYGHYNTMLVVSGNKNTVKKYVNIDHMTHVPDTLKLKIKEVMDNYAEKTS